MDAKYLQEDRAVLGVELRRYRVARKMLRAECKKSGLLADDRAYIASMAASELAERIRASIRALGGLAGEW